MPSKLSINPKIKTSKQHLIDYKCATSIEIWKKKLHAVNTVNIVKSYIHHYIEWALRSPLKILYFKKAHFAVGTSYFKRI